MTKVSYFSFTYVEIRFRGDEEVMLILAPEEMEGRDAWMMLGGKGERNTWRVR